MRSCNLALLIQLRHHWRHAEKANYFCTFNTFCIQQVFLKKQSTIEYATSTMSFLVLQRESKIWSTMVTTFAEYLWIVRKDLILLIIRLWNMWKTYYGLRANCCDSIWFILVRCSSWVFSWPLSVSYIYISIILDFA